MNTAPNTQSTSARAAYYRRIDAFALTPLWESLHALVPKTPTTAIEPAHWRYAEVRPLLAESGELISAMEAERRVLILENPALRGQSAITQSLYAGLQLILPGEVAPAHRHSQSALRLVLEGETAFTAVDGERIPMTPGDFIITPAHTWHDHGNTGNDAVVWLDGLDIPLVRFFEAGFAEKAEESVQRVSRAEGDSLARYGSNLVPLDSRRDAAQPSRLCHYPYKHTRAALADLARGDADPHYGHALRFNNPETGHSPMPTIGTFIQLLPAGFETRTRRSTDSTIVCCLEGGGTVQVGERTFQFAQNDIFVIPSWSALRLQAGPETVLFSYSDRPVQQALGLWKEERI